MLFGVAGGTRRKTSRLSGLSESVSEFYFSRVLDNEHVFDRPASHGQRRPSEPKFGQRPVGGPGQRVWGWDRAHSKRGQEKDGQTQDGSG